MKRAASRRLRLTRKGALRPGRGRVPKILRQSPKGERLGTGILAALIAERGEDDR